jgi:hypothetical protein
MAVKSSATPFFEQTFGPSSKAVEDGLFCLGAVFLKKGAEPFGGVVCRYLA